MTDVIGFRFEKASADLVIWGNGTATLSSLYAITPGQGHGSGVMHLILDYADAHDLTLILVARRFKNPRGLSNDELVKFYEKFGFVSESLDSEPIGTHMTRQVGAGRTVNGNQTQTRKEGNSGSSQER